MSGHCGICRQSGHIYRHCESPIIGEKKSLLIDTLKEKLRLYSSIVNYNSIRPNQVLSDSSIVHFNNETSFEDAKEIMLKKRRSNFRQKVWSISIGLSQQIRKMPIRLLQLIFPDVLRSLMNEFGITLSVLIYNQDTMLTPQNINSVRFNTKKEYHNEVSKVVKAIMHSFVPNDYFDYSNVIESELIIPPPPPPRDLLEVRLNEIVDGVIGDTNLINNSQKDTIISLIQAHYREREYNLRQQNLRLERHARRDDRRYRENISHYQRQLQTNRQQAPNIKFLMDSTETEYIKEDACPICMEELTADNTVALSCNHTFCSGCTGQFIKSCNGKCPSCRAPVKEIHFQKNINIEDYNALVNYLY